MNICNECREECEVEEEIWHYSGTHCTHGQSGIHHTGWYYSVCCSAEFGIDDLLDDEDDS